MFKVIICGSRHFDNKELLFERCNFFLQNKSDIQIVSGAQRTYLKDQKRYIGADYFGEQYAEHKEYSLQRFPANWDRDGRSAGPLRNARMADYADAVLAFWDGKTRGTNNMLALAKMAGLPTKIVFF